MKTLLIFTVCLTATLGDSLNQQLLLAKPEERSIVDPPSPPPPPPPHSKPPSIKISEFKDALERWETSSNRFIDHVRELKPMALQTLTRAQSWDNVLLKMEETFENGENLYEDILGEALDVSHRLFENAEGFGESGRCKRMINLAPSWDPVNDPLAEVKSAEAIVSDLDCFAGELQDTISTLGSMCAEGEHFGADKALGMIGKVMQVLYRFKHDGERFIEGGQIIADKAQKASKRTISGDLIKRLLEKYASQA